MPEQMVDRLRHRAGLTVELLRREDTPEGCLVYRKLLWDEPVSEQVISESQANGLVVRLLEEGFQRE